MSAEVAMGNGVMGVPTQAGIAEVEKALNNGAQIFTRREVSWLIAELRAALAARDEAGALAAAAGLAMEGFRQQKIAAETALTAARAEHEKSETGWRAVIAKWRNDYDTLSVRYTRAMEALQPLAALKVPFRPHDGNAGAYSIRFSDIERAKALASSEGRE